jgi:hypothetical protein
MAPGSSPNQGGPLPDPRGAAGAPAAGGAATLPSCHPSAALAPWRLCEDPAEWLARCQFTGPATGRWACYQLIGAAELTVKQQLMQTLQGALRHTWHSMQCIGWRVVFNRKGSLEGPP